MFWGKKSRGANAHAVALAALLLVFGGVAYAAGPISLLPPPVETVFRAKLSPRKLPAHDRAPVSLDLLEGVTVQGGSHPPALQELGIELDRHLSLSVKGLPRCGPPLQELDPRSGTLERCEDALVGGGVVEVDVAFPEQQPVKTSGRIYVYNGGVANGRTRFWLYTFISAPVTGAIFMPLDISRRSDGIYGWKGRLKVPKIANGAGSITYLRIHFSKGIFSATCPTGRWQGRAPARFADGTVASGAFVQHCRTSGSG